MPFRVTVRVAIEVEVRTTQQMKDLGIGARVRVRVRVRVVVYSQRPWQAGAAPSAARLTLTLTPGTQVQPLVQQLENSLSEPREASRGP